MAEKFPKLAQKLALESMDENNITQVSWGKTINTGNYETVRLDITARVGEDEDWREVLKALKLLVREQEQIIRAKHQPRENA